MGIPIVYFRSSSFNCHRFCPQQYLVEYFLGWRGPSNKKADKGTIVHKVLEVAALAKKAAQDGKKTFGLMLAFVGLEKITQTLHLFLM